MARITLPDGLFLKGLHVIPRYHPGEIEDDWLFGGVKIPYRAMDWNGEVVGVVSVRCEKMPFLAIGLL